MKLLTRFWLKFTVLESVAPVGIMLDGGPFCFGITAYSYDDALHILRKDFTIPADAELSCVIEDVDISTLDTNHVLPNLTVPPSWRGIWYPAGFQLNKLY
jgi:hypothetical protein